MKNEKEGATWMYKKFKWEKNWNFYHVFFGWLVGWM